MLSGSSSRPTILRGDPHESGVTGSARQARQEQAARHSQPQRSSMLHQVRTHFDDQTSPQSNSGGSSSDDSDYEGSVGQPFDWTVVRGHAGKFARAGPSNAGASDHVEDSHVDNAAPRGRRRQQCDRTDWLITSPQPEGPGDARLIPNYGGHIAKVSFEGSERTPSILECRTRKKSLEDIIRLQDISDELYGVLPAIPLGRLLYVMHQHNERALILVLMERWQPDTNTFHMPFNKCYPS